MGLFQDNVKLAGWMTQRIRRRGYFNYSTDEIYSFCLASLWECTEGPQAHYDPDKAKLATYYASACGRRWQRHVLQSEDKITANQHSEYHGAEDAPADWMASEEVEFLMDKLTDAEYNVIYYRYFHDKTLREVGDKFGYSHQYAHQLEKSALNKMNNGI
jgi:RNA polymerase sigma factor (sigma-70 family)